ncbi:MAG: hypothetical protein ACRD2P_07060 [Terriglobia bacterium]
MISENNGTAGVHNVLGESVHSGGNSSVYSPAGHWLGPVFSSGEQWAPMIPGIDGRPHLAVYDVGRGQVEFMHRNLIGSTEMNTTYSGAWMEDKLFYPWCQEGLLAGGNPVRISLGPVRSGR